MGIGVGESRFLWGVLHPQMSKLSHGASQSPADLPEALGLGELAEQHRYKMVPGAIPLRIALSTMLHDQLIELNTVKKSNQLTKQACTAYHGFLSSLSLGIFLLWVQQKSPTRRTSFSIKFSKPFLDKSVIRYSLMVNRYSLTVIRYWLLVLAWSFPRMRDHQERFTNNKYPVTSN